MNDEQIMKMPHGDICSSHGSITVGELERFLLASFPAETAEDWDKTGLLVGDPHAEVKAVAVGLDVTKEAISQAYDLGANVLLTHHPAFLEFSGALRPDISLSFGSNALIWEAASKGISLMNFHTALDVSRQGAMVLPSLLNLNVIEPLIPHTNKNAFGFGACCTFVETESMTLRQLSARCVSVFGREPRVWGNVETIITKPATWGGSTGHMIGVEQLKKIDCLIVGEVKYHEALALLQEGLVIIELGHDVSELPLTIPLSQHAIAAGLKDSQVYLLDQSHNWYTPLNTRI